MPWLRSAIAQDPLRVLPAARSHVFLCLDVTQLLCSLYTVRSVCHRPQTAAESLERSDSVRTAVHMVQNPPVLPQFQSFKLHTNAEQRRVA